jgi:predicted nuclease of predicted toxin-antitoxin system
MRLLLDQNISHKVIQYLPDQFKGSTSVKKERLINLPDKEIWEFAKENDFIIVTQDSDFNNLNSLYGFPPKVIWIRTGNLKTMEIVNILIDYTEDIEGFLTNENYGCLEIVNIKKK